jgi:hypothetical protein
VLSKKNDPSLLRPFQELLQESLAYFNVVSRVNSVGDTAVSKFWRSLAKKVYDILDKMTSLLPSHLLLECISALLGHKQASIQKKALDLLNARLTQLVANTALAAEQVCL